MLNKSDSRGVTYNLGLFKAASVTCVKEIKKGGEKVLGFQHSGMYVSGSGLNGALSEDITIVKILPSQRSTTAMFKTIRAATPTLSHHVEGEELQMGHIPEARIGHQLTLISPSVSGCHQAILR